MPVHTTRPRAASINRQAALNSPSSLAATAASASASMANTRRPLAAKSYSLRFSGDSENSAISEQGAFR